MINELLSAPILSTLCARNVISLILVEWMELLLLLLYLLSTLQRIHFKECIRLLIERQQLKYTDFHFSNF